MYTNICWHNKSHNSNNSWDTRNNLETWKCYKPEYHYGSILHWIVDNL